MTALFDIVKERSRQQEVEGFEDSHDAQYTDDELVTAAVCYALDSTGELPQSWPWDSKWWKPTDRRRNLVKAAALIAAEIDRMDND